MMAENRKISEIAGLARQAGMSYGRYVAVCGDGLGADAMPARREKVKVCVKCGGTFTEGGANRKLCDVCSGRAEVGRKKRATRVYERECTLCGGIVRTTQAPRRGCNLYCDACRPLAAMLRR